MSRRPPRWLLVPAGGRGEGAGHLVRCVRLAGELGGGAAVFAGELDARAARLLAELVRSLPPARRPTIERRLVARRDLVLLDRRRTTREELERFARTGTVVCLDEGGEARRLASYTLDALPRVGGRRPRGTEPNAASLSFLGLPDRRPRRRPIRRVLVSFGAEDAAGATGRFLERAILEGALAPEQLTVVEGPLSTPAVCPRGVRSIRLGPSSRVSSLYGRHDLLVTHFGISALEALAGGLPVVLLNPTRYHRALSRRTGIPEIGVGAPDIRALRRLLERPQTLWESVERFRARLEAAEAGSLAEHLRQLGPGPGPGCPSCGAVGTVVARFALRTYRRCSGCRLEYLEHLGRAGRRYGRSYFEEEYRSQYGRTYLEDFASIKAAAVGRLQTIEGLLGKRPARRTILDVGCAFGPFLDAARDRGWSCLGIDVAAPAVRHVRSRLGIPALRLALEDLERRHLPAGGVEVVTLWYVIEHLDNLADALKRVAGLLPEGGVLAFSTPNGGGISARSCRRSFLERSPADHRTVLSPRGLARLLRGYGLRLRRVRVTGHHPERFPAGLGRLARSCKPFAEALAALSRLFALGDTFEAYAVRSP